MARAKRTDRAAARRRHRAQLGEVPTVDPAAGDVSEPPAPATNRRREGARTSAGRGDRRGLTVERPAPAGGIRNAFRLAFRPLNLREDISLLPRLLAHRAFWVPALLAAVTTGVVVAFQGRELISGFALTYFVYPPPIGGIFLAGFLAPRASYLIGALVGVVSSVLLAIVVAGVPSLFGDATPAEALFTGLVSSPLSGVFFGAAAAWYRRFLYLASPARQMPARRPPTGGRPARGR